MALLKNSCILQTTNNDGPSIITPRIPGTAIGTINGVLIYSPAKHGNGSYDNNNSANHFDYPQDSMVRVFNPNLFLISFWFDSDWSMTAGVPSDAL